MRRINLDEAKKRLPDLIDAAVGGDEPLETSKE